MAPPGHPLTAPQGQLQLRARRWLGAHHTLFDAVVVLLLEVWVLGHSIHEAWADFSWAGLLISQLLVLPLVLRRRYPVQVFWFMAAVAFVQWLADLRLVADAALIIALYTVSAHKSRRDAIFVAAALEVGVVLAAARFAPAGGGVIASLIFLSGLVAAALLGGISLQTRRQYLAALVERATRLEFERDQQLRLAATAERSRIARELHDVIAHSLSVVITLADGAALANATQPAEATNAMYQVAATGRASLAEMRRLLGVLREDDPTEAVEFAPQPGLDRLDGLITDVRSAGLPAQLSVTGTPRALAATAQSAAYRIVQESLTNVMKHAHEPRRVLVAVTWSAAALRIEVTDDGQLVLPRPDRTDAGRPDPVGGHGMIGMRERAALFDATIEAGPGRQQGWRVSAVFPLDEATLVSTAG